MKKSKKKRKTPYVPRVVIKMNTGTCVMSSKKDKSKRRKELNKQTREEWQA